MSVVAEPKRRNVIRVALFYLLAVLAIGLLLTDRTESIVHAGVVLCRL